MKKRRNTCPKKDSLIVKHDFKSGLSLLLDNDELLSIEKTAQKHIFGLAIDLGTSTIEASLCNLENNEELSRAVIENSQIVYGEDLPQRYKFALKSRKNLTLLQQAVIVSLNKAIDECVQKSGVNRDRIYAAVIVGNPGMRNFLLGMPVSDLKLNHAGSILKQFFQIKAKGLGLAINSDANIKFLPDINNSIGSDVLASVLALNLFNSQEPKVCIDVGISAKIILGSSAGVVVVCADAAAFSGLKMKCAMPPIPGAIEWVRINEGKIKLLTIGHIYPVGLCGSGIIDLISELLREGIVDKSGLLKQDPYYVYKDKMTVVSITGGDIKNVQSVKAAISASVKSLMRKMKVTPREVKKVYFSGALGYYLNVKNIIKTGFIPDELKKAKIEFAANIALAGAQKVLFSRANFIKAIRLAGRIRYVSISNDAVYKREYLKSVSF